LTNPTKLFDFLEKDSIPAIRDMGKRWSSTFGALGALQKMTKSRHIDDPKQFVVDWRTAATHFFDLQKRYFPNRTTTPKMHQLKGTALTFPSNITPSAKRWEQLAFFAHPGNLRKTSRVYCSSRFRPRDSIMGSLAARKAV
jgi:hypothetical protein